MTEIPIADPQTGEAEVADVVRVLESGQLAAGDAVAAFESEFADHAGTDHAVATMNGTAALHATLEAIGIEPGRSVVTTPFSFVATANAIRFAGGIPVFVDIDPETFNIDPYEVEEYVRDNRESVDAIVAVHLYGLPAEMDHLRDIADTHDLVLVEDAAQAHGARYGDEPVGSLADAACFSFYPTKNMTTGEGGMVTTDRDDIADGVRQFINHGRDTEGYAHVSLGHNFRMTDLAAAIGRVQLSRLPDFVEQRRQNAHRLTDRLAEVDVETPVDAGDRTHAYHQYTIRCSDRDQRQNALERQGVGTGVYYPNTIPDLAAYDGFHADIPSARRAAEEVLSLPVHPSVTVDDIDHIAAAIEGVASTHE